MTIGAETFVSAALQPLFDRLFSLVEYLVVKLRSSGDLAKTLKKWKTELRMVKAVLVDAEHKQFQSEAVKEWVDDLQDLAFDMEDVLEDFAMKLQRQEFNTNMDQQQDADQFDSDTHPDASVFGALVPANMVTRISNNLSTMFNRIDPDIQEKMEELTGRLQDFQGQTQNLGLSASNIVQQPALQTEALRDKRESSSLGSEVFGRDDKKQNIITQLLEGDQGDKNYVVIPIVGMGGIGKTTLAQYAYNNEQVQGIFNLKAWVCVSDVFDVKRITTAIFKATVGRGTAVDFGTVDEAQTQLMQALTSKKFLIVLDDIWNEDYGAWSQLQGPFQHAARGSRVIMTTRNKEIARMMNTYPSHNNIINLKGLSDKDCWCVFQQHANNDSDLAELRDDIIKKCKGLPLAAKVLAGLLKKTVDMKLRRMILESDPCSKESGVLPVLRLSYHYLPSHLKRIFAYCSVLRKDYKFTKMEVILLWMAQGFLPENQAQSMEDLGHSYFNDLVSRSLFEQGPYDEESFIMHDLVHDLALWAEGKISYVMDTNDITQADWQRIRHVFFPNDARITLESQLPMASQLRTFYCDHLMSVKNLNFIKDFRYIRTLRLTSATIEVLPEYIGELKYLRFLDLEFERIKELPKSISNLWNLQTLCLKFCFMLEKVPNIGSLEKLRHLEIRRTSLEEMPMGLEKLTNLKSLDVFVLGHGRGARLRELKDLNHLEGELTLSGLENVSTVENAREAQLYKKCKLDKLYLTWGDGRDEVDDNTKREVLEQLKPHSSIKECSLEGYRGFAFPAWLEDPCFNNMAVISLKNCKKCECLPHFQKSLRSLEIRNCEELTVSIPRLPLLGMLTVSGCKELTVSLPSLPLLEKLQVIGCKIQLITTEDVIQGEEHGLSPSPKGNTPCEHAHLTKLTIHSCPSLISFPEGLLLPALELLDINNCANMESLPCQMHKYTSLRSLIVFNSPKIQCFSLPSSLSRLHIQGCPELEYFEDDALPLQLTSLKIHKCPKLQFSVAVGLPLNLTELSIRDGIGIDKSIREWGLHLLTSLKELYLQNVGRCTDTVESIPGPDDLELPSSLSKLRIEGFQNLKSIRCSTLPNLIELLIWRCPELESFADDTLHLKLGYLNISSCPKLQFFPEVGLPLNLIRLSISDGVGIDKPIREWGLHLLTSLKKLYLQNVGKCTDTVESIPGPDDLELPSSLSDLGIEGFQNLKSIRCSTLPNLIRLWIKCCPHLESFDDNTLPPFVYIERCDLIRPRLRRNPRGCIRMGGDRWSLC